MAMFVHLAPEGAMGRIRKNGLRPTLWPVQGRTIRVLFAMPVTREYFISHQWLRELKRRAQRTLAGVYFKLHHDEEVYVGHFSRPPEPMTAGEAIGILRKVEDARGFQVLIPRRVEAREIVRIRTLQQGIGWRYWPESHGKKPCPCDYCQKGLFKGRKLREATKREKNRGPKS